MFKRKSPLTHLYAIRELINNGFDSLNSIQISFDTDFKQSKIPKTLRFPASSFSECKKFSMVVRTLNILIENLERKYIATRRDIYYQDVVLFENQQNVDSIIALICSSLHYKDFEIGAIAAQKGIFWGKVDLLLEDGHTRQSFDSSKNGTMLIPRLHEVKKLLVSPLIKYVLIIEKEAVFNALCNYSSHNTDRILVTGKGFPDQLTRTFVSNLSKCNPNLVVFGISDLDPYGMNILRIYKNGGPVKDFILDGNMLEASSCPNIRPLKGTIMDFVGNKSTLSDLNTREITMIINNFKNWKELRKAKDEDSFNRFLRLEFQRMLFLGKKSELDAIRMNSQTEEVIPVVEYIDKLVLREMELYRTRDLNNS